MASPEPPTTPPLLRHPQREARASATIALPYREVHSYREIASYLARARYVAALCHSSGDEDECEYGIVVVPAGREAELLGNWGWNNNGASQMGTGSLDDVASIGSAEFAAMERRATERFSRLRGEDEPDSGSISSYDPAEIGSLSGLSSGRSSTSPIIPHDYLSSPQQAENDNSPEVTHQQRNNPKESIKPPRKTHLENIKSIGEKLPAYIRAALCLHRLKERDGTNVSKTKEETWLGMKLRTLRFQKKHAEVKEKEKGNKETEQGDGPPAAARTRRRRQRWNVDVGVDGEVDGVFYGGWTAALVDVDEEAKR